MLLFIAYFGPTPGASGIAEFTNYWMLTSLRVDPGVLGIYTVMWRFFTSYAGVAVGGLVTLTCIPRAQGRGWAAIRRLDAGAARLSGLSELSVRAGSGCTERRHEGCTPVTPATQEVGSLNIADEIERLRQLHQTGAMSDDEFARAKDALLRGAQAGAHAAGGGRRCAREAACGSGRCFSTCRCSPGSSCPWRA